MQVLGGLKWGGLFMKPLVSADLQSIRNIDMNIDMSHVQTINKSFVNIIVDKTGDTDFKWNPFSVAVYSSAMTLLQMKDFELIFYRKEEIQRRQPTSKLKAHSSLYFSRLKIQNVLPKNELRWSRKKIYKGSL